MDIEGFWSRVAKTDTCWLWVGYCLPEGYGRLRFEGRLDYAHRVSYVLTHGPIPEGLQVDHVKASGCTNRHCVNPAHLEAVSSRENTRRGDARAGRNSRKTQCIRGHLLSGDNLILNRDGNRKCRECSRFYNRLNYAKRHATPRCSGRDECLTKYEPSTTRRQPDGNRVTTEGPMEEMAPDQDFVSNAAAKMMDVAFGLNGMARWIAAEAQREEVTERRRLRDREAYKREQARIRQERHRQNAATHDDASVRSHRGV